MVPRGERERLRCPETGDVCPGRAWEAEEQTAARLPWEPAHPEMRPARPRARWDGAGSAWGFRLWDACQCGAYRPCVLFQRQLRTKEIYSGGQKFKIQVSRGSLGSF